MNFVADYLSGFDASPRNPQVEDPVLHVPPRPTFNVSVCHSPSFHRLLLLTTHTSPEDCPCVPGVTLSARTGHPSAPAVDPEPATDGMRV